MTFVWEIKKHCSTLELSEYSFLKSRLISGSPSLIASNRVLSHAVLHFWYKYNVFLTRLCFLGIKRQVSEWEETMKDFLFW